MVEALCTLIGVAVGYILSMKQIQSHKDGIKLGYQVQTGSSLQELDKTHDIHSELENDEEYKEQKHFEELHENYYSQERWDD